MHVLKNNPLKNDIMAQAFFRDLGVPIGRKDLKGNDILRAGRIGKVEQSGTGNSFSVFGKVIHTNPNMPGEYSYNYSYENINLFDMAGCDDNFLKDMLSTHPDFEDRIREMVKYAEDANLSYKQK